MLEQDPETEQVREVGTTAYTDDGQGGDPIAGDGVYTASFQVPEDRVA